MRRGVVVVRKRMGCGRVEEFIWAREALRRRPGLRVVLTSGHAREALR